MHGMFVGGRKNTAGVGLNSWVLTEPGVQVKILCKTLSHP